MNSKSNVFKILDLTQKQETLTSVKYERVNLGNEKKKSSSQPFTSNQRPTSEAKIRIPGSLFHIQESRYLADR